MKNETLTTTSSSEKDEINDVKSLNKKGKKFRGNRRGNQRFSKPKAGNDFAFWNEYPELMSIAARFPWMHIPGTALSGAETKVNLPNVAIQHFVPIPGVQDSATSPLNLAFRQMYLDMHRKYRGIGTYQASDIAITILCIESVLQMLVEAERIYGILNRVPVKTRIQPYGLLKAIGYSEAFIKNVASNMADFRYGINRLIDLAKRLPLPKGMTFCDNHISMNGFVYTDSKDDRADLIVFVCDAFFVYQTTGETYCVNGAGTAYLETFGRGAFSTYSDLLSYIEDRIDILLYDSDILRITSDFIACYGEDQMQGLYPLEADYTVIPTYSESILLKWHNSERRPVNTSANLSYVAISSTTTQLNRFVVYQENDVIYSRPVLVLGGTLTWASVADGKVNGYVPFGGQDLSSQINRTDHIVDTWTSDPTIDMCCESVLWKHESYHLLNEGRHAFLITNFGTELLSTLEVFSVVNGDAGSASDLGEFVNPGIMAASIASNVVKLVHFDWHPYTCIGQYNAGSHVGSINTIMGDTDNVSVVTSDVVSKVVDAALLSAFKVKTATKSKE